MSKLTESQKSLAIWFNLLIDFGATKKILEERYKPKDKEDHIGNGFYWVYKQLYKEKLINVRKLKENEKEIS